MSSARFSERRRADAHRRWNPRFDGIDTAAGRQVERVRSVFLGGLPAYLLGGAAAGWVGAALVRPGRDDAQIVGARPVRPAQQPPHHLGEFFPADQRRALLV